MAYIVTHPGRAHFDEVVACAILIANTTITRIERRNPTFAELTDPNVFVVDTGAQVAQAHYEDLGFEGTELAQAVAELVDNAEYRNFEHHHNTSVPCAYALVARFLGIKDEAKAVFPWWKYRSDVDTQGPTTANLLAEIEGNTLCTISPVEGMAIALFEGPTAIERLGPYADRGGLCIWDLLEELGQHLMGSIRGYADARTLLAERADLYPIGDGMSVFHGDVVADRHLSIAAAHAREEMMYEARADIPVSVFQSPRGEYSLYRFNDDARFDMTRVEDEPEVTFAHRGGFLACVPLDTPVERILELVKLCQKPVPVDA